MHIAETMNSVFLTHLQNIEPEAQFTFSLPIITSSVGTKYYAKVGSTGEKEQYMGEAESLRAIHTAAPGLAPKVFASGVDDGRPYFLSEYKDLGILTVKSGEILGQRLANELHAFKSKDGFGFSIPTYCGATRQDNGWFTTWEECYSTMIENLLLKLEGRGRYTELVSKGEEVRSRWVAFFF